jgi:hypothetical protein
MGRTVDIAAKRFIIPLEDSDDESNFSYGGTGKERLAQ